MLDILIHNVTTAECEEFQLKKKEFGWVHSFWKPTLIRNLSVGYFLPVKSCFSLNLKLLKVPWMAYLTGEVRLECMKAIIRKKILFLTLYVSFTLLDIINCNDSWLHTPYIIFSQCGDCLSINHFIEGNNLHFGKFFSFYNKPNGNISLDNKTFENIGHQISKRNTWTLLMISKFCTVFTSVF